MSGFRNSAERYGLVARLFHGATFLAIAANLVLGFVVEDVETGEGRFAALHATLGILVLALLVGRVLWRFVDPPPPITVGAPLERTIAHAGHLGLYALMLLVALSGWFVASHEVAEDGGRIELIGGAALPTLGAAAPPATSSPALPEGDEGESEGEDDEAGELWEEVHEWSAWALLALVLLHAAAALMHRQRKDGTWERMFG